MRFTVETASDRRQQTLFGIFTGGTEQYFVPTAVFFFPPAV